MSPSYLGKRLRDEAPLNANDMEAITRALGEDPMDFIRSALDGIDANYRANLDQDKRH